MKLDLSMILLQGITFIQYTFFSFLNFFFFYFFYFFLFFSIIFFLGGGGSVCLFILVLLEVDCLEYKSIGNITQDKTK